MLIKWHPRWFFWKNLAIDGCVANAICRRKCSGDVPERLRFPMIHEHFLFFFVGKSRNSEVAPPTSSSGAPWIISPLTKNKNPKKNGWQNSRHSSRRPRSIQTGSSSFLLDWKIMGKRSASENTRKHLGGPWPPFFNLFAPNNCIPIWTCRWSTSKCTQHSPSLKSYLDGQHFIPTPSK